MRCRRPLTTAAAAAIGFSLLAAGCGANKSSSGVASVASTTTTSTTTTTTTESGLVAFSQCMRSSGISSFPDPQRYAGGNVKLTIHQLGNSPHLQRALAACSHLLPRSGGSGHGSDRLSRTELADALSFARCMRNHGVSRFPDPTVQGGLTVEMVQAQGIDVHSPAVLRVVQTCLPASHGALTATKIREAIANAGG
jgi:hypothetical protein